MEDYTFLGKDNIRQRKMRYIILERTEEEIIVKNNRVLIIKISI